MIAELVGHNGQVNGAFPNIKVFVTVKCHGSIARVCARVSPILPCSGVSITINFLRTQSFQRASRVPPLDFRQESGLLFCRNPRETELNAAAVQ